MTDPDPNLGDVEDYLATMRGLASGAETEVDPKRAGDVQAFRDFAEEANGKWHP